MRLSAAADGYTSCSRRLEPGATSGRCGRTMTCAPSYVAHYNGPDALQKHVLDNAMSLQTAAPCMIMGTQTDTCSRGGISSVPAVRGCKPAKARSNVDLPQPLGPSNRIALP